MDKKILISLLSSMSFATAIMANAATVSTGAIGFTGRVFAATEAVSVRPNGEFQVHRAATRISSQFLTNAKPVLNTQDPNDLFDYFAGYARASANVVTVAYH